MVRRCRRERRPRVIDKLESPLLARGLLLYSLELAPSSFYVGKFRYVLNKFYKLQFLFQIGNVFDTSIKESTI